MIIEAVLNAEYGFWKVSLRFRIPLLDLVFTSKTTIASEQFPGPQAARVIFCFP